MDWQPVNESILDEALAPNEIQKIRMKRQDAVQQGAPDPVAEIVTAVPAEIRSRIGAAEPVCGEAVRIFPENCAGWPWRWLDGAAWCGSPWG